MEHVKPKIVGLIGFIGSGKDTVASQFIKYGCQKDSFAAPLKDLVSTVFGWDRALLEGDSLESRDFRETADIFWSRKLNIPHFTPRLALQLVGTDVMREHFDQNIWLNSLEYRIRTRSKSSTCTVVSDARFQNELNLIRNMGGIIIWVKRGPLPEWYQTAVDANAGNVIARRHMETKFRDVHRSEWDWVGVDADFEINNDSTLENLYAKIDDIRQQVLTPKLKAI